MFGVAWCNASCFGIFLNIELINCFWKIRVVLKRTFKCFTAVVQKKTDWRQVQWLYCSAVCCRLTAGEAKAGLAAEVSCTLGCCCTLVATWLC